MGVGQEDRREREDRVIDIYIKTYIYLYYSTRYITMFIIIALIPKPHLWGVLKNPMTPKTPRDT